MKKGKNVSWLHPGNAGSPPKRLDATRAKSIPASDWIGIPMQIISDPGAAQIEATK